MAELLGLIINQPEALCVFYRDIWRAEARRENVYGVSMLMRGKTIVTASDYRDVFANCRRSDVIYMDPPYQGVCGERDSRYYTGISFDEFVLALDELNERGIRCLISYDGRLGERSYGEPLPAYLNLTLVEIEAGRSSQATLLGRDEVTFESLYLSKPLADELGTLPRTHHPKRENGNQPQRSQGKEHKGF